MDEPQNPANPQPSPGAVPPAGAAGGADGTKTAAEQLAADALKAAQAAVMNLTSEPTPPAQAQSASDEADAAMAAAMAAIGQAKSANAIGSVPPTASGALPTPLNMPSFGPASNAKLPEGMDLLSDVNLNVKIELGRTRMLVEDVLRLGEGSVVELNKLAGDPVDVYVNERHVARGEVLVLNDNFCVRINEIVAQPTGPS